MRIVTLDTETTGMKETDQVCELALVSWNHPPDLGKDERWSSLIKPTCPVSIGARAVHHISDEELADKRTFAELMEERGLPELGMLGRGQDEDDYTRDAVCVAAHNFKFDYDMLRQSYPTFEIPEERRICTWRCAMHLYPDSEDGHSNQVLRYYLDLRVPLIKNLPPHRALPDAVVTAEVLKHMLQSKTPRELVMLTSQPVRLKTVRFGKHRGKLWDVVPSDYLDFILRSDFDADVMHTARTVLESRNRPLLQRR